MTSDFSISSDEDEDLLEISVETLLGAAFEMRLPKNETISSIKSRLQKLEGIPRSQMHLLHRGESKFRNKYM